MNVRVKITEEMVEAGFRGMFEGLKSNKAITDDDYANFNEFKADLNSWDYPVMRGILQSAAAAMIEAREGGE